MVNPIVIAAGISAAGGIASSLLAKGGGGTGTANRKASRGQVRGTVQGAREAGLHPLAVLGGGTGGGFAQPVNPMAQAIASASQDVSRGVLQYAQQKRGDKADAAANQNLSAANADILLNNQSNRTLQEAQTGYWQAKTLTEAQSASQLSAVRGNPEVRSQEPTLRRMFYEMEVYDRDKNFATYMPDPEIMEGLESMGPAGLALISYFRSRSEARNRRAKPPRPKPKVLIPGA